MKKILMALTVNLLCVFAAVASSDTPKEKIQLIDKILEQTGQSATQVGQQFSDAFLQQMFMVLKQTNPEASPKVYDIVKQEVNAVIQTDLIDSNALNKMMYPIYSRHFSVDELKQIIALNETEFGKKMIQVMPLITQEGMQAGQTFGMNLGPKIQQRIQERLAKEGLK